MRQVQTNTERSIAKEARRKRWTKLKLRRYLTNDLHLSGSDLELAFTNISRFMRECR